MKFAAIEIGGEMFALRFTVAAYAEAQEKFGTIAKAFEVITGENINDLVDLFEILARNGELSRRYLGYEPRHIYTRVEIMTILQIKDVPEMRNAVMDCVLDGVGDTKQNGPIDKGLLELQKKETLDMSVIYRAALAMGMSLKELYNIPFGQFTDMMEAKNGN